MSLPRPTEPEPPPRQHEILDAVRHVFAEKGFDGASMQELARAAGMSVGNFYRYFPSKDAMVEAMVQRDLEGVEQQYALLTQSAEPLAALRQGLHQRVTEYACHCTDAPIWAEIVAAALRKPELADVVGRMESEVARYLLNGFAMATGLPRERIEAEFSGHARMMMLLVRTVAVDSAMHPGRAGPVTRLALRQIDSLLDEIAACRPQDAPR